MKEETSSLEQSETLSVSSRSGLLGLAMVVLLSSLNISVVNVALPTLAKTFSVTMSDVQWLVVVYLLAMTCLMPFAGFSGDRFGRKPLLLSGIAIFFTGTVGCVLSEHLALLTTARFIQGTGAALLISLAMTFVGDLVPSAKSGFAMGLLGTTSAIGTALGPALGGVLMTHFHWHSLFGISLPLCILSFLLLARWLPDHRPAPKTAAIKSSVMTQLQLNKTLFNSCLANFLVSAVIMSTMVVGPFYLTNGMHMAPENIGLLMSVGPVVSALTGAPAGKLTDSRGPAQVIQMGLWVMLAGCLLIALGSHWATPLSYGIPLVLITAGYATFQAANNTLVMKDVPAACKGVTSAFLNFSRNSGLMAGASVMGWLYLAATEMVQAGQNESVIAFAMTFLTSAGLVALALAILAFRKQTQP